MQYVLTNESKKDFLFLKKLTFHVYPISNKEAFFIFQEFENGIESNFFIIIKTEKYENSN